MHQEINVIGQHAEEARDAVDEFLDRAVMATASRVRIVHGHGMGVLKKMIRSCWQPSPRRPLLPGAAAGRRRGRHHRGIAGIGEPMSRITRRFLYIAAGHRRHAADRNGGLHGRRAYPPFDAFYMTLITMTTVGYAEIHPLSQAGRIFNSFLIIFGVTTIFIAVGAMTQTIIEIEFGDAIGKRRNKRMIEKLKDHYIICGFGRVGRGAAAELQHAGAPFVVVDIRARARGAGDAGGHAGGGGRFHARRNAARRQASNARAAWWRRWPPTPTTCSSCSSAKGLNPRIYVAARAAEEGAEEKMRRAGADAVFAPYAITGHRLAQSLLRPHVVQFLDFTTNDIGKDIAIEQVRVSETSDMVSKSMREMQLGRDVGVIVLAIRKGDGRMHFNPPADTAVHGGDYLIVMGRRTTCSAWRPCSPAHLPSGGEAGAGAPAFRWLLQAGFRVFR